MYRKLPEDDVGKVGQRFTKGCCTKPGLTVEGASTGKRMLRIEVYSEEWKCTRKKNSREE